MTTLAARLNPTGSLLNGPGGDVSALSDLAQEGVVEAMPDARVAVVLRDPLFLARALIALDGQVDALLLLSAQAKSDVITQLMQSEACTHLLTDREDLEGDAPVLSLSALLGTHREAAPRQTSWLMTTSGTTGLPKIIPHTLASLSRTVVKLSGAPVWGMLYDPTRFAGMQLLLQGLIGGGQLVLVDTGQALGQQVADMAACSVTHLSTTPTLWRRILMAPKHQDMPLTQVTMGGEIADQGILTKVAAAYPKARITHIYAATETGVGFAVNDGKAGFPERFLDAAPGGVGVKVDDKGLWLRPPGTTSPPPAPSVISDEDGYLFTGDMVERKDGRIYFLGRDSGVINVGGVKVHPERVEATIAEVPGVALVKVSARKNPFTGALVLATVQPDGSRPEDALREAIVAACQAKLEREAAPAIIKFAPDLEINAAGKIVRNSQGKTP